MPFVHAVFTVITFGIIPIIVILQTVFHRSAISQSAFCGALWINCITSGFVIIWDFMQIGPIFALGIAHYKLIGQIRKLRGLYTTWDQVYTNQIDPEVKGAV